MLATSAFVYGCCGSVSTSVVRDEDHREPALAAQLVEDGESSSSPSSPRTGDVHLFGGEVLIRAHFGALEVRLRAPHVESRGGEGVLTLGAGTARELSPRAPGCRRAGRGGRRADVAGCRDRAVRGGVPRLRRRVRRGRAVRSADDARTGVTV